MIFALFGLFLNQYAYLEAIHETNAGTATVLQYLCPVGILAYTVFLKGTTLVGPVKSSLLASIEPISAVFFAFLIMQEQFYALDFLGMAMILVAVMLISLKDLLIQRKKGLL